MQLQLPLPLNEFDENPQNNEYKMVLWALLVSVLLHIAAMQLVPLIKSYPIKKKIEIEAEIHQAPVPEQHEAPPPPPPPASLPMPKPAEPQKPQPVKQISKPVENTPILKSENAVEPNAYQVPESRPVANEPRETKTTVAPAPSQVSNEPSASPEKTSAVERSNNSSETWDDNSVWDEYGRNLQALCERNKQYPQIAIRRNLQGAGKVLVRFSQEGVPSEIIIEKSTGQKVLDEQALQMVRKSLDELAVPKKFKGREFKLSIPFSFKLE